MERNRSGWLARMFLPRFESRHEQLAPPAHFRSRFVRGLLVAGGALLVFLGIGVLGYHGLARLPWIDALLNASMILAGMGPVDPLAGTTAKLFASIYALASGVAFLSIMGILIAPLFHRFMHQFHLEAEGEETRPDRPDTRAE